MPVGLYSITVPFVFLTSMQILASCLCFSTSVLMYTYISLRCHRVWLIAVQKRLLTFWPLLTNVPSKFFSVCAEENGVWAAHFDAWVLQLNHFRKRQIRAMSGGDPEGSAASAVRFWPPIFGWNRCVSQHKNKCFLIKNVSTSGEISRIFVKFCLHLTGYFLRIILKAEHQRCC